MGNNNQILLISTGFLLCECYYTLHIISVLTYLNLN